MLSRRTLVAALFVQLVAAVAVGQEFGRASGGQVVLSAKGSNKPTGSLGLRTGNATKGLEATLGGTLIEDRLWFFGSASMVEGISSRFAPSSNGSIDAIDAKLDAQIGRTHAFSAAYTDRTVADLPDQFSATLPSSFLSLRYDGVISSNAFFSAHVSRSSTRQPVFPYGAITAPD
ncbi:MAG: hypothetical protein WA208_03285 [Thermoanaerobaculia bacterium]